ncbi:MAG: CTP synthase [Candidatus Cloacimonetes bacterium]|nr:CTP synthase [Candidatus Cloacimonadota bacterium]
MSKFIFVMGGVISSLGKGIAVSSIGLLLKSMGYKISVIKLDPYINVDPGTMSPFQHGEVFVTEDGAETDLDLGHYERFVDKDMGKHSNTTSGQIYESVINKERKGIYLGKTVQVIPHITNEIIDNIRFLEKDCDIVIVEIGGTIGDIESLPFVEAVRQLRLEIGIENSMFVLLTYVPFVKAASEIKTKPTQHSVYKLREIGVQPDVLLCRSEKKFDDEIKSKIALFTNVVKKHVVNAYDVNNIYKVPQVFRNAGLHEIICKHFHLECKPMEMTVWDDFVERMNTAKEEITIAVCGKYVTHQDAYRSIEQSLIHAGAFHRVKLNIRWVDTEKSYKQKNLEKRLEGADAILVPGGFGMRGLEGKVQVVRYARKQKLPFFGICLGLQAAVIEFARHECNLKNANSTEFDEETKYPIIYLMEEHSYMEQYGGNMRLGAYPCELQEKSLAEQLYDEPLVFERHRHRWEFNNKFREKLEQKGMVVSGTSMNGLLAEIVEIPEHPFFIGVQFHPEFKSRPNRPHPLFTGFIEAAIKYSKEKR